MIDRIQQTVKAYLNTDQRGNFKPEVFDVILHNKVLEAFEELFFDVNQMLNRQNRGLINGGLENIPDKIRERIEHYIEPPETLNYIAPYFTLPSNMHYFDNVMYNNEMVELCKSTKEFKIIEMSNPTETYPIGLKQGNLLSIRPSSIINGITVSYLRKPNRAKWTYQIVDGVEIFDNGAADFVDVDIHPSMEVDITIRVIEAFGVNLKEKDIQEFTQREEATTFNQERTS